MKSRMTSKHAHAKGVGMAPFTGHFWIDDVLRLIGQTARIVACCRDCEILLELNWWGSPNAPWYGSLGVSVVFHIGIVALFAGLWFDHNRPVDAIPVAAEWSNRTDTPMPDIDFERPSESGPRRCPNRQPPAARKLVRKSNSPSRVRR